MRKTLSFATALGALSLIGAGQAQAHAHLTAAEPGADAVVAAPKQLVLHFSEKMLPKFSGLDLAKADGGKVKVKASAGSDSKSLVATPQGPLAPGVYTVVWHAVTADTHRMEGTYSFKVR